MKTEYFKHSFNLTANQIDKIKSAKKDKLPTTIRLKKSSFKDGEHSSARQTVDLPLTKADANNVIANKGFDYALTKCKLKMLKIDDHTGGFLPIPLLLAGLTALGGLTAGAAKVADSVITKQTNDKRLEEEKRSNMEREKILRDQHGSSGLFLSPWKSGTSLAVKEFVSKTKLDPIAQRSLRAFLKNLNDHIKIEKNGDGLYLSPYL
jgi:hypothetical protein